MTINIKATSQHIPKQHDLRRSKLTDQDREDIKEFYYVQGWPIRKIARYYEDKCSKRLIQFILFPERLATLTAKHKAEKHHLKYYNKDKWCIAMRRHRAHKKEVLTMLANQDTIE